MELMVRPARFAVLFLVFGALVAGGSAADEAEAQGWFGGCNYEVDREVSLPAAAAETLEIRAGAGGLRVEGRSGLTAVRATGHACASDEETLEDLQITLERDGRGLLLGTHYSDRWSRGWLGGHTARIDLVVEVPTDLPVDIEDGSGSMEVSGTSALYIRDGSGSVDLSDINGSVRITDGSGSLDIDNVAGDVDIEDGSGSIEVRQVAGSVRVSDGSGSIHLDEVDHDVIVDRDGSGSITVRDVLGDFVVHRDGSGRVAYRDVEGRVDLPRNKR